MCHCIGVSAEHIWFLEGILADVLSNKIVYGAFR
jgi:hypothetical protein